MIVGDHAVIRAADLDDSPLLHRLYDVSKPRSFLLGPSREVLIPTRDELQEVLSRKDLLSGVFFVVEDKQGELRGCCSLRGVTSSAFFSEMAVALVDEADYATPLADEVMDFIRYGGFHERKLRKLMGHCLDREARYREFLVRHGFVSNGVQREMVYALGRYFDLESLSLFRDAADDALQEEAG
ncbi:MAG: GNAT family N-acetyltransferase [Candidatus Hydrogenedentes bacterium]|nr:GNAT family N-acetyltransferase [Candidatus Hydrogenedentota bacterium]